MACRNCYFRDGCNWLFQQLHKCQVPLLVFSAGVGDILIEALQRRAVYCDNMKVVSNFMDFNDKVGFYYLSQNTDCISLANSKPTYSIIHLGR